MMYGSFSSVGSAAFMGLHIHWVFVTAALVGAIAVIVWMIKFASKKELASIAWMLVIIGAIGAVLTAPLSFRVWQGMMGGFDGTSNRWMMQGMMDYLQDKQEENPDWDMNDMVDYMRGELEE